MPTLQAHDWFVCLRRVLAAAILCLLLAPTLAAQAEVPPSIRHLRLNAGDVVVRINYAGQVGESWLTLKRLHGQSAAGYFVPPVIEKMGIMRPPANLSPDVSWETLWTRLETEGLYDLPDAVKASSCRDPPPVEAEVVSVEIARGSDYRSFTYVGPMDRDCPEARKLASILRLLQLAFRNQLPFPK